MIIPAFEYRQFQCSVPVWPLFPNKDQFYRSIQYHLFEVQYRLRYDDSAMHVVVTEGVDEHGENDQGEADLGALRSGHVEKRKKRKNFSDTKQKPAALSWSVLCGHARKGSTAKGEL
jgi:hypothetical protein